MLDLSHDRWQRLDDLLAEALERDPDERTAFLRAACGDDPDLYHAAVALVERAAQAEADFGESATGFAAPLLDRPASGALELESGAVVGPYRIVGEIGRGGMGAVYLAERADGTFEKQVALKLVQHGTDTDAATLARFRRERQILAGLDHPGIARLLDAGATDDGRPYLVMEFVEGEPITAYCDRHGLGVEARLALVEQVAEAVAHAHRRFVVHRDLKPSNILVAESDGGQPQVKLLDFGIARLLDTEADAAALPATLRLTPAYAAPEQFRGEAITAATDVYAVGVLLYELLTEQRPFDLGGKKPEEMEHLLSTSVPPAPSAVATGEAARRLRGDLDAIMLKTLAANPEDRYPSVEALLDDLRRHGAGVPVEARPAKVGYQARKFVQRHRAGVAATAAFVLLLLVAVAGLALQQQQTARERDRAEAALLLSAQSSEFLASLFEDMNPTTPTGDTLSAVDVLDRGRQRIANELADTPELRIGMLQVMSRAYKDLPDHKQARDLLRQAYILSDSLYGPNARGTLSVQKELASSLYWTGERDEARRLNDDWIEQVKALPNDGTLDYTDMQAGLGELLYYRRQYDEAEHHLREAYEFFHANGTFATRTDQIAGLLVTVYRTQQAFDKAEPLQRERIRYATERGSTKEQSSAHRHLASIYHGQQRYDEARASCETGIALLKGSDTAPLTLGRALFDCADLLRRQGDEEAAAPLFLEIEAIFTEQLDTNTLAALQVTLSQAAALVGREDFAEAEQLLFARYRALEMQRSASDPALREVLAEIVTSYERWRQPDRAAPFRALLAEKEATAR